MPKCEYCGEYTVVDSLLWDHLCAKHELCEDEDG